MTRAREIKRKFNCIVFEVRRHRAVIQYYIEVKSTYDAYKVKFKSAGFLVTAFSAGMVKGMPDLHLDPKHYRYHKHLNSWIVQSEVTRLLARKDMKAYLQYLKKLAMKTRNLEKSMSELRKKVGKMSSDQGRKAALFGKGYTVLKAGADTGVAILGVAVPVAGTAVSIGYNSMTETIAVNSDPKSAGVVAWKGTGSGALFAVLQESAGTSVKSLGGKVIPGVSVIVSALFAVSDMSSSLRKFDM